MTFKPSSSWNPRWLPLAELKIMLYVPYIHIFSLFGFIKSNEVGTVLMEHKHDKVSFLTIIFVHFFWCYFVSLGLPSQ